MEHPITVLPLNFPTTTPQRAFDASVNVYLHDYAVAVRHVLDAGSTDDYTDDHTEFDWQDIADSRDLALKDYLEAVDLNETTEADLEASREYDRQQMEGYLGDVHRFATPEERLRLKEQEVYHNREIVYSIRRTIPKLEVSEDQEKFEWDLSEAFDRVKQHHQLIRNSISITWGYEHARWDLSRPLQECYYHVLDADVYLNTVRQGETAEEKTMRGEEVRHLLFWHKDRDGNWERL